MDKRRISAHILRVQGVLILVVAAIHLAVTPLLRDALHRQLSAPDFEFAWPPLLLSFVVMGILLIPIGVSTLFCASGVRSGAAWSWRFGITNALALVGLSMCGPLLWVRGELKANSGRR
jgi:hypothetical protein